MSARSTTSNNTRKFCLLAVAVAVLAPVLLFKSYFFPASGTSAADDSTVGGSKQDVSSGKPGLSTQELLAGTIPKEALREKGSVKIEGKYQEVKVSFQNYFWQAVSIN